ncbi:MAG: aldo/keto reductase [Anaerolineae bacterium]|jgi:aryl-alcohol dehydrogenase-like predicted oxidoreductase|nr:aldo/keto reductase [Anaerolineae bacterium]MBT7071143.1 aldo/keto reductase [Anaerolineae bacterium]MBT7602576.1 aldo/keto reductase [Anaerolineae bacterium]MBT7990823.1 aldo/keto reductase [Anaerolineae bacterium]
MKYRQLGSTGIEVSALCLGTMQFGWTADEATSFEILSAAHEAGINFIDTADIYSRWAAGNSGGVSEEIIGRWWKQAQIPRDSLVIATKVRGMIGNPPTEGLSRERILKMVEDSLRRLQVETIDLYQAHWADTAIEIEETLRAFDDLVQAGKVRAIGCSNYSGAQLAEALKVSEKFGLAHYATLQPHFSLVHRDEYERELAKICREKNIGVIPYSPLAAGFLTGKYRRDKIADSVRAGSVEKYFTEKNWRLLDKMDEIAAAHAAIVTQVALAWQLADKTITSPIIGANSISQLTDSLGAVDLALAPDEKAILDELSAW